MSAAAANKVVLLVEDDADDVALIQRAFHKANLRASVRVVSDGEAAIRCLRGEPEPSGQPPDARLSLVLLDLKLPRKSGLEVLQWARSQPDLSGLPIVVLTSSQDQRDLQMAYDSGANSFLVKPVEFEQLRHMVQTLHLYWLVMNEVPTTL